MNMCKSVLIITITIIGITLSGCSQRHPEFSFGDTDAATLSNNRNTKNIARNENPIINSGINNNKINDITASEINFAKNVIKENDKKVIMFKMTNGLFTEVIGSGFFIKPGVLATNFHVVDRMTSGQAIMTNGEKINVTGLVAADTKLDLAIVKLEKEVGEPVSIGNFTDIQKGDSILVIGSPLGLQNTVSVGMVSNLWKNRNGKDQVQITAPITHGNSGGALFNDKGDVIGIPTAIIEGNGELNFAVSIDYIKPVIEHIKNKKFTDIKALSLIEAFK